LNKKKVRRIIAIRVNERNPSGETLTERGGPNGTAVISKPFGIAAGLERSQIPGEKMVKGPLQQKRLPTGRMKKRKLM